jgi:hypothetical protein
MVGGGENGSGQGGKRAVREAGREGSGQGDAMRVVRGIRAVRGIPG